MLPLKTRRLRTTWLWRSALNTRMTESEANQDIKNPPFLPVFSPKQLFLPIFQKIVSQISPNPIVFFTRLKRKQACGYTAGPPLIYTGREKSLCSVVPSLAWRYSALPGFFSPVKQATIIASTHTRVSANISITMPNIPPLSIMPYIWFIISSIITSLSLM